jgi:hypothetical protein
MIDVEYPNFIWHLQVVFPQFLDNIYPNIPEWSPYIPDKIANEWYYCIFQLHI